MTKFGETKCFGYAICLNDSGFRLFSEYVFRSESLVGLILRILRERDHLQIQPFVNFFELDFSLDVLRASCQTTSYLLGTSSCRLCFCAFLILRCIDIESFDGETVCSSILSIFAGLGKSTLLETFLTVSLMASDFSGFSASTTDGVDS